MKSHDKVASLIHWHLIKIYGFSVSDVWWKHLPDVVCENNSCWNSTLVTESPLPHNRSLTSFVLKNKQEVYWIDIAILGDTRIAQKSVEELDKYIDL